MKSKSSALLIVLGISLFFGLICSALGTAFTPIMAIGGAVVCRGEFGIDSQSYSYKPGQIGVTRSPYCIDDQTREKRDVTFPLIVADTVIYGVIIFALMFFGVRFSRKSGMTIAAGSDSSKGAARASTKKDNSSQSAREKLSELKKMLDSDLITKIEYERKKAEILKDM